MTATTDAYTAARIARGLCPAMGRDWAGRYMACTLPADHRFSAHRGEHGGRIKRERMYR